MGRLPRGCIRLHLHEKSSSPVPGHIAGDRAGGTAAGIEKRIHPHLFRKSRITELVRKNYQESVLKETFWANPDTSMFRTYLKLSEKDIDDEFLRRAGLKTESEIDADTDKPASACTAWQSTLRDPSSAACAPGHSPQSPPDSGREGQLLLTHMDQDPRLAIIEQKFEEFASPSSMRWTRRAEPDHLSFLKEPPGAFRGAQTSPSPSSSVKTPIPPPEYIYVDDIYIF